MSYNSLKAVCSLIIYYQSSSYSNYIKYKIHTADNKIYILNYPVLQPISRAHSFPRPTKLRAEPQNLGFCAELSHGIFTVEFVFFPRNAAEFDVFHSNNYFFTENDLKVALLQVC